MREIQELDIRIKIDSHRREELMAELSQHTVNRCLFINEREPGENVHRFTPGSTRYDLFMYCMSVNMAANSAYTEIEEYQRMYGTPIEICKKMKVLNDGYEQMRVEWVQIPTGPGHERQDAHIDTTTT